MNVKKELKLHLNKEFTIPIKKNLKLNLQNNKLISLKNSYKIRNKNYEINNALIYENFIKKTPKKISLPTEWYIKRRQYIIEIIDKIGKKYNFSEHVLYLSLLYCDTLLKTLHDIPKKEFNINIITSIIIAYKFSENNTKTFKYKDICKFCKKYYIEITSEDIYNEEINILQKLKHNLNIPTINDYIKCMNLIGIIYRGEEKEINQIIKTFKDVTKKVSLNKIALEYNNEVISMSIVRLVRKMYEFNQNKMQIILKRFNFKNDNYFNECYQKIKFLFLRTIDYSLEPLTFEGNSHNISRNLKLHLKKWNSETNNTNNNSNNINSNDNFNYNSYYNLSSNRNTELSELKSNFKKRDSILKIECLKEKEKKNENENLIDLTKMHKKILSQDYSLPKIQSKFFFSEENENNNNLYKKHSNWVNFFSNVSKKEKEEKKEKKEKQIKLKNNQSTKELYINKNSFRSTKMSLPFIRDYPSTKRLKK